MVKEALDKLNLILIIRSKSGRILLLGFLTVVLVSAIPKHAIYLSVVELTHAESSTLTVKVFTDDLQDVIRNYSSKYVPKPTDQFVSSNQELINNYFNENLLIQINGKKAKIRLEKTKKETEAHFLYFSVRSDPKWSKVEVKGAFFTEVFPTQSNIFTLIHKKKKYFARLTKSDPSYAVTVD